MPFLALTHDLAVDPAAAAPSWQPAAALDANDLHDGLRVLVYPDGADPAIASAAFRFPADYGGGGQWVIRWKSAATAGGVVWAVGYNAIAVGESADPVAYAQAQKVTSAAAATARDIVEAAITPAGGNFAAGDTVMVSVARDLADGNDTMADEAELVEFGFNYTAA